MIYRSSEEGILTETARSNTSKLREFEQALDEAVANDDQYLQMIRDDRTRLSRDTNDWMREYSLDRSQIVQMAEKLMKVTQSLVSLLLNEK